MDRCYKELTGVRRKFGRKCGGVDLITLSLNHKQASCFCSIQLVTEKLQLVGDISVDHFPLAGDAYVLVRHNHVTKRHLHNSFLLVNVLMTQTSQPRPSLEAQKKVQFKASRLTVKSLACI